MAQNSEVRWDEFDKMLVVRRLRELVGRWWKVQINFTDEKGFLRGVPDGKFFNPLNSLCQGVIANEKGFNGCRDTARKNTVDMTKADGPKLSRCHAGFSTLSVPIRMGERYLGSVFGDGFLVAETATEQKAVLRDHIGRHYPDQMRQMSQWVDELPILSSKDVGYLTELIQLVVDEIVMVNKVLNDQKDKVDELSKELGVRYKFDKMIGKSKPMQDLYRLLDRVCDSDATVLINGENGTGKELIARALHYNSRRADKKFLTVNCGAFNENLLESELFGHVKGSFTGAIKDKKGLFEAADGGTLFLDEIGDTSMAMQVKMLRVLQEGTFTPVGSTVMRKSSVRVLAATNKDLPAMVRAGTFREDLYYRLNVINVLVPPLRERSEDIQLLVDFFLDRQAKGSNGERKSINAQTMEYLMDYEWPGNVRQLENEIERLCVLAGSGSEIIPDFLSPQIREAMSAASGVRVHGKLKDSLEELEKQMILEGLQRTGWNKSKLAKELGISRAGLIMKVDKYALEKRKIG